MSSSDKAKSKLLDSMRMSKQGSSGSTPPVAEKPAPAQPVPAKASPKKSTAAKAAVTKAAAKPAAKTTAVKKPIIDNFQTAQRVWPD